MTKYVILDPAFADQPEGRRIVSASELDGIDQALTVIPVDDDFSWLTHTANFNTLTVETDLSPLKAAKEAEIQAARDMDLQQTTCPIAGHTFFTTTDAKVNMLGRLLSFWIMGQLGMTLPTTVKFKTTTGYHQFTMIEFMAASLEVLGGIESIFESEAALLSDLANADTIEDVQAISW